MQIESFVLPTLATLALGTALLVPLRDDRRGKRATISGNSPLRAAFRVEDVETHVESTGVPRERRDDDGNESADLEGRRTPTPAGPESKAPFGKLARSLLTIFASMSETGELPAAPATETDVSPARDDRSASGARENTPDAALGLPHAHGGNRNGLHVANVRVVEARRSSKSQNADTRTSAETPADGAVSRAQHEPTAATPPAVAADLRSAPRFERSIATRLAAWLGLRTVRIEADAPVADEPRDETGAARTFGDEVESQRRLASQPVDAIATVGAEWNASTIEPANVPDERREANPRNAGPAGDTVPSTLVIASNRPHIERVLPLTRLPLRPQSTTTSWPALISPGASEERSARHGFLAGLARVRRDDALEALRVAYREEDAEGRALALRALSRFDVDVVGRTLFLEALRSGSDDERSLAVDALSSAGEREALRDALSDRVEAIAAKAALAYVDSTDRVVFETVLAPLVDEARLEAILALLAGVFD